MLAGLTAQLEDAQKQVMELQEAVEASEQDTRRMEEEVEMRASRVADEHRAELAAYRAEVRIR